MDTDSCSMAIYDMCILCVRYRNAWQKLGAMPAEEAMQKYLEIITELYPTWAAGSSSV